MAVSISQHQRMRFARRTGFKGHFHSSEGERCHAARGGAVRHIFRGERRGVYDEPAQPLARQTPETPAGPKSRLSAAGWVQGILATQGGVCTHAQNEEMMPYDS